MPRPKIYDDELRDRLIEAAADVLATKGVDQLALRTLAASQGTSTNAVYSLFGNKGELVAAVCRAALASFAEGQRSTPVTGNLDEDFLALGRGYRNWALDHPALYAVIFSGRVQVPDEAELYATEGPREPLERLVARGIEEGTLVGADFPEMVVSVWAMVHGFVTIELAFLSGMPRQDREATYEAHLRSGLRAWRNCADLVPVG